MDLGPLNWREKTKKRLHDRILMASMFTQTTPPLAPEIRCARALNDLLRDLASARTADDVCQAAARRLVWAAEAADSLIVSFGQDGRAQVHGGNETGPELREAIAAHIPWPHGAGNANPVSIADVRRDETFGNCHEILSREQIRALAFIPLSLDTGVLGALVLCYPEPHEFVKEQIQVAETIASAVVLALDRLRAMDAMARTELRLEQIVRDSATGDENLLLAAIVANSDDAIVSKDLNGIIRSWNKGAERVFGYSAEEAIGRPITILAPVGGMEDMRGILRKVRKGERVDHYETIRRRKNGETIHVSLTVSPVKDASGRIIGASKIARDITERKLAERERALLLEREQDARKTAELLNQVGSILAAELDTDKLVQAVTDVARELVGAEFGSFLRTVPRERGDLDVLHATSGAPQGAFKDLPMPPKPELTGAVFRGETLVRSDDITQDPPGDKNATYFNLPEGHSQIRSYLAAPVISRSGDVLGGLFFGHSTPGRFTTQHEVILSGLAAQAAIAMDNAHLFEQTRWAQEELKRSNEELRRANQDLESFAYSASHDLQEPVRTMAVSSQLLQRRYGEQLSVDAQQILEYIVEGARRMEALIMDILAYSTATKTTDGPPPLTDSGMALESALANLRGPIEQSGATILSEPLPVVLAHKNHLIQLFQNLVGNSIKYRKEEAPRVQISAINRDGWSIFSVVDNGIGIESRFADYIFGLFKRLHGRQEHPGSGIGLAICQRIVERYGGRIWLEHSVPNEGSTFCFTFPTRP